MSIVRFLGIALFVIGRQNQANHNFIFHAKSGNQGTKSFFVKLGLVHFTLRLQKFVG